MASCCCRAPPPPPSAWSLPFSRPITTPRRRSTIVTFATRIGAVELVSLLQNKVLVSAIAASAVGQLAKPLTKALNGEGFDLRAVVTSGGMPSAHSAAVAAASASLGFERGFSDSIFGMSVVFAAIIMYDAQGVRREVGKHAQSLNEMKDLQARSDPSLRANEEDLHSRLENSIESESSMPSLSTLENPNSSLLPLRSQVLNRRNANSPTVAGNEQYDFLEDASGNIERLNESVGHTEIQVLVGALLGFLAAFSVETIP